MRKWVGLILTVVILCISSEAWANIVLKTLVVNPSQTKTQEAILKTYLPKEVKPADVVELHDLKIDYDVEKGLYFVYKKFELSPGESASRSIEIRDIWVISKAELEALTGQAKEIIEKLRKTGYFDAAVTLQKDIETKSNEILNAQEQVMNALPQTHIAVYRENVEILNAIKNNLAKLDEMLLKVKITAPGVAVERVSVKVTWWLILAVIISLGLLSLVFYIIWHRQAMIVEKKEKVKEKES